MLGRFRTAVGRCWSIWGQTWPPSRQIWSVAGQVLSNFAVQSWPKSSQGKDSASPRRSRIRCAAWVGTPVSQSSHTPAIRRRAAAEESAQSIRRGVAAAREVGTPGSKSAHVRTKRRGKRVLRQQRVEVPQHQRRHIRATQRLRDTHAGGGVRSRLPRTGGHIGIEECAMSSHTARATDSAAPTPGPPLWSNSGHFWPIPGHLAPMAELWG